MKSEPGLVNLGQVARLVFWFTSAGGIAESVLWFRTWLRPGAHRCLESLNILWAVMLADGPILLLLGLALWVLHRLSPRKIGIGFLAAGLSVVPLVSVLTATGVLHFRAIAILSLGIALVGYRWIRSDVSRLASFFRETERPLGIVAVGLLLMFWAVPIATEHISLRRLPPPNSGSPNILLIVLDTLRADRLGAYGYPRSTTPFLDQYAQESVLYEKAFAPSSWTLPSHVSIFTGREPQEHGAVEQEYDGRYETLAQVLGRAGYVTAGISANTEYATCAKGVAAGFLHYENTFLTFEDALLRTGLGTQARKLFEVYSKTNYYPSFISAGEVNRRILDWLERRPDRPFFVFLNYMDTHYPYLPPQEFASRFPGAAQGVGNREWSLLSKRNAAANPEANQRIQDTYDASVAYLDSQLRNLFTALQHRGLDKGLLVAITSDHGESLGEHNLFDHRQSLYLEQIRVPLIVRLPDRHPAGARFGEPVSTRQIAATVATWAVQGAGSFPGPVVPVRDSPQTTPSHVFSHLTGARWAGVAKHWPIHNGWQRSVVSSRFHLIVGEDGKVELFDWVSDPGEQKNLAQTAEAQLLLSQLLEILKRFHK